VTPLLMLGGIYLCLEGVEKLAHPWLHSASEDAAEHAVELAAVADEAVDLEVFEAEKIKGAIRTDFVLSAEIIVIALGTVASQPFTTQLTVLAGIALLMTFGVYGLVGGIVKMDDVGAWLLLKGRGVMKIVGKGLLLAAPKLMKTLTIVGTAAMFLVGGGILSHGMPPVHHGIEQVAGMAGVMGAPISLLLDVAVGVLVGVLALCGMLATTAVRKRLAGRAA